jgi:hypothetical protein
MNKYGSRSNTHDSKMLACHMPSADQPKITTFRVDADVLARLDAYAARTRRSRNSAVNYLLVVGLDAEEAQNPTERPDQ